MKLKIKRLKGHKTPSRKTQVSKPSVVEVLEVPGDFGAFGNKFVPVETVAGKFDAPCNPALAEAELVGSLAKEFPSSRLGFSSLKDKATSRSATFEREAIKFRERALQQIK